MPETDNRSSTKPVETVDLAVQVEQIRQARDAGHAVPAGRLLGLPELPGDDVWVDIAGASAITGLEAKTITGYLNRGQPKRCPFPGGHRILYRLYWPLSTIESWCEEYGIGQE